MTIDFHCLEEGRPIFAVSQQGMQLFVGARDECDRFVDLHNSKVRRERCEDGQVRRHRPFVAPSYRVARLGA